MRGLLLILFVFLIACDTAGPGFRGIPAQTQVVDGSTFRIRVNGNVAELIRINPEPFPRYEPIAAKAAVAVYRETGCTAAWVEGDPSMMLAGLSCNGSAPPRKPPRRRNTACAILSGTPLARC